MQNPWIHLPKEPPFILPEDKTLLDTILWKDGDRATLRFEMYPVPYIGNPETAEIYLLTLNPGFKKNYREEIDNPEFVAEALRSFTFASNPSFYCLDPRFSLTDGFIYYKLRFKQIIDLAGRENVAKKIMCIEYFPYHSEVYRYFKFILPSQQYTFHLVREAMRKNKIIIYMRSKKLWEHAIPELAVYPTMQLKSYRASYLSKRNLGEEAFEKVIHFLKQ